MRTSWRDIKNRTMTKAQQERAHKLAMQDLAEMQLRDLREALQVTQVTLAKKLKTTQAAVSRLEKRPHMFVKTLGDYVEALGGTIEVRAILPDRTVSLTHFLRGKTRIGKNVTVLERTTHNQKPVSAHRKRLKSASVTTKKASRGTRNSV